MPFAPGALVVLKGLTGATDLNGSRAKLEGFVAETGRWKVSLDGGRSVNAKPENLTEITTAKDDASFEFVRKAPPTKRLGSYYGTDPDSYQKARVVRTGEIKSTSFDHKLYTEMSNGLNDGGKLTLADLANNIWPAVADGRFGKQELTCNERWTIRFGLGEFDWQFEARVKLLQDLTTIDVLDVYDKKVTDKKELAEILNGPSLEELEKPPAKKLRTDGNTGLIWVDGMYLDKGMLKVAREAAGDDGVVDCFEAVNLFHAAADGDELTCCERWTLRFILSAYIFTDAAFDFIKEALAEREPRAGRRGLKYTESFDP